jgi:hypothetical protein
VVDALLASYRLPRTLAMSVFFTSFSFGAFAAHNGGVAPYVVTPHDLAWFRRCRRAWDWTATERANLALATGADPAPAAIREALAIYYFPGMWHWPRAIVAPLVPAKGAPVAVMEAYMAWAAGVDRFTPVRVEADVVATVPDPVLTERSIGTADGEPVHYRDRLPMIGVDDGDDRTWVFDHRVVTAWTDPDELALDERWVLACWAWHDQELATEVAGVQHTEVRVGDGPPEFRRTVIEHSLGEQQAAVTRLGRTAMAMVEASLSVEPTPDWAHCGGCEFRPPCIAMNRGADPRPLLVRDYRVRPDVVEEPGRIGGVTWSIGRGAAPPQFRRGPG